MNERNPRDTNIQNEYTVSMTIQKNGAEQRMCVPFFEECFVRASHIGFLADLTAPAQELRGSQTNFQEFLWLYRHLPFLVHIISFVFTTFTHPEWPLQSA